MTWNAYSFAKQLVAAVKPVAAAITRHDPSLAGQLRRAVASIPLNLAEAGGRAGRDRKHHIRIANGSAKEVRAALQIAGMLDYADVAVADQLADTVCAIIFGSLRR